MSSSAKTASIGDLDLIVNMPYEDQQRINRFARIHQHYMNLKRTMEALEERVTRVQDAEDEMLMAEEDGGLYTVFGTGFIPTDNDGMTGFLDDLSSRFEKQVKEFNEEITQARTELQKIKSELGTKYGKALKMDIE